MKFSEIISTLIECTSSLFYFCVFTENARAVNNIVARLRSQPHWCGSPTRAVAGALSAYQEEETLPVL